MLQDHDGPLTLGTQAEIDRGAVFAEPPGVAQPLVVAGLQDRVTASLPVRGSWSKPSPEIVELFQQGDLRRFTEPGF